MNYPRIIQAACLGIMCVGFITHASPVEGADQQTIRLKDGSVIQGQLVDMEGDYYIIDSPLLGEIELHRTDVHSISAANTRSTASETSVTNPQATASVNDGAVQAGQVDNLMKMQLKMMNQMGADPNAAGMQMIDPSMISPQMNQQMQALLSDPEISALLQDEQLIADLMSMDPNRIQSNPRFQTLIQNPKMQQIINEMTSQMMKNGDLQGLMPSR